jgi:hypothetical protein
MQIYFAGIESPAHLNVLRSCGVERVAVSINNLARHTQKYDLWPSKDRLGGLDWIIYSDAPSCPVEPALELVQNADVAPEGVAGPVNWFTDTWLKDSDLLLLPTWDGRDHGVMRIYAEQYEAVMLPDAVVDNQIAVKTAKAALPVMGTLAGLTGRSKSVHQFDVLVSSAWWAVQKHGETQVWANNRFVRLNSDDKHAKRIRYADAIEALGCDVSAVLADDPTETVRCSILSWKAYEAHLNSMGYGQSPSVAQPIVANSGSNHRTGGASSTQVVASPPSQVRHRPVATAALQTIPVMAVNTTETVTQDDDGTEHKTVRRTLATLESSSRQCTTCKLSAACPAFNPGADNCAIGIPMSVRTKDELRELMSTLIEMQSQRAAFAVFSEQVLGESEVQTGKEMDRVFTMIEKAQMIEQGGGGRGFRMTIEGGGGADGPAAGLISRLFGSEAGANAKTLDRPRLVDEVAGEIMDGDVVGSVED